MVSELVLKDVNIDLGPRRIISGVSLTAAAGELIGLIGANSVGKSTLIRGIAGLIPAASGTIQWQGQSVPLMAPGVRARTITYLPQGQTFHWDVSVRHVVALGRVPHLAPMSRMAKADDAAIATAMERAEILHLADRSVMQLSGGERSRVLFARALATDAPVFLADEPTTSLDPYHQLHAMELLRQQAEEGKCVIAVLHDLSLAARFCDRVIVLHDGRVIADAPPRDALTPEHLTTAYQIEVYRGEREQNLVLVPWKRLT
jgi:iron complex transport system ATP-binding protein